MPCFKLVLGSTAFCVAATLAPAAQGDVSIINLGALYSGSLHTGARGLNNTGIVVGYSQNDSGFAFPFRWQGGVMSDFGAGIQGSAEAVNDGGQIVGYTLSGGGSGVRVR
jgi:probable HAF family extracellular repeat protein